MGLSLEFKENDPKTLILLWEAEPWREVSKSLFFNELKRFPHGLGWEDFLGRYYLLEEKIAKKHAIVLLSKRSYLSANLESKLLSKGLSPQASKVAILFCQEKGYLNDAHVVARLIAKEQKKGLGAKAIFFKLRQQKKISEQQLRQELNQTELSEKEVLEQWLRKNARKIQRDDPLEMRKLMAKLMRRGFSSDVVFSLLKVH